MRSFNSDLLNANTAFRLLVVVAAFAVFFANPTGLLDGRGAVVDTAYAARDKSDLNGDNVVDLQDLELFSQSLGLDWQTVDWCQWIAANAKYENQYAHLFDFIRVYFACGLAPEMDVFYQVASTGAVADGDTTPSAAEGSDFGSAIVADSVDRTFTIANNGTADLYLYADIYDPSVFVAVTGDGFALVSNPDSPVAAGGTTTFTVRFTPAGTGLKSGTVSIANDDSNENPYNFSIKGTGVLPVPVLASPVAKEIRIPNVTFDAVIVDDAGYPITERGTFWNTTGPPVDENRWAEGGTAAGPFSHTRTDLTGLVVGTRVYFRAYATNAYGTGYSPVASFVVPDPLVLKNTNPHPTRLAVGLDGRLYVSDPKVNSVFIYNADLQVQRELKDLHGPVGVAVDGAGFIYVGNAGLANVEKYTADGAFVATIGQGTIRMPTDLTVDWDDNLYVADIESSVVWVFAPDGALLRTIRKGGIKAPISVEVAYYDNGSGQAVGEVFVANRLNWDDTQVQPQIKVYDLQGNFLREFGVFPTKEGWFKPTWQWQGKFVSPQSLAVDAQGYLHVLDLYMHKAQILDPVTGAYLGYYGNETPDAGPLKAPLDIVIDSAGNVIVANTDSHKVEVIYPLP